MPPQVTSVGGTQLIQGIPGGSAYAYPPLPSPRPLASVCVCVCSPICTAGTLGQCAVGGTEIVCSVATGSLITSGGGFSGYAARPSYQDAVCAHTVACACVSVCRPLTVPLWC